MGEGEGEKILVGTNAEDEVLLGDIENTGVVMELLVLALVLVGATTSEDVTEIIEEEEIAVVDVRAPTDSDDVKFILIEGEMNCGPGCEEDTIAAVVNAGAISVDSGKSIDVSKSPEPKPDPIGVSKTSGVLLTMFVITVFDTKLGIGTELSISAELVDRNRCVI